MSVRLSVRCKPHIERNYFVYIKSKKSKGFIAYTCFSSTTLLNNQTTAACSHQARRMEHFQVEERLLRPSSTRAAGFHSPQCWETNWEVAIRQSAPLQSSQMHVSGTRRNLLLIHELICSTSWLVKSVSFVPTTQPWHN